MEQSSQLREQRKRALFEAALDLPPPERLAYVRAKSGGDPELQQSVLRLLAAERTGSGGILDRPVHQRPQGRQEPSSIGKYAVSHHLGDGGMGSVYACRQPGSSDLVAVKILRSGLRVKDFLEIFEQERRILLRLQHPNVSRILDAGAHNGEPFIVMECVAGEPIDFFCARRRYNTQDRLHLFSQVLAGVAYFHRQNVVHRDLKPSNILVTGTGKVKILDFGIAKMIEHQPGLTGLSPTQTPNPAMTLRYASPEQLNRRLSGRSSDIYSLGVILYELLTGHHPYEEELRQGMLHLVRAMGTREPVAPSAAAGLGLSREGSAALDRLVLTALLTDPTRRYRSAEKLLDDIRLCVEER
jgi:eukaryotic-like serine/threonine-protein kinase